MQQNQRPNLPQSISMFETYEFIRYTSLVEVKQKYDFTQLFTLQP